MWSTRLFRSLLWCYPAPFRHEYGSEMARSFAEELRDVRDREGRFAAAAVWLRSIAGVAVTAPQEHYFVIRQDVRYAVRSLAAQPGFAAVAVLSLALGIGANVAIYSLVDAAMLRMLPVRDPEELVILTDPDESGSSVGAQTGERTLLSYPEYLQLRSQVAAFSSLMAAQSETERLRVRVNGAPGMEQARGRMVSAEYFATLGIPPLLGRTFGVDDGPAPNAAVISHDYWQRRFAGSPDAVGATIALRHGSFTVIGVMPPAFFGETVGDRPDVWLPLGMQPVVMPGRDWLHDPPDLNKPMWLHAFGRLKPGVTLERAQSESNAVFRQGLEVYYSSAPTEESKRGFLNQTLRLRPAAQGASVVRAQFGEPLLMLQIAAGLVLLIACANLGNLTLSRAAARTREIALRVALGAGRGSLIRQLLTESMVLALAGGIVGLAAAYLLRLGLLSLAPDAVELPASVRPGVLAFAFAITALTGILMGALPAWKASRLDASAGIKEQARGTGGPAWLRAGKTLAAAQLALSLPLLAGAGLLVQTLRNLQQVDLGYSRTGLLMATVDAREGGYTEERRQALFDRLLERVRQAPGVHSATYSRHGLFGGDAGDRVSVEGYVTTGEDDRGSNYDHVGPDYFATMGVPILEGREIGAREVAGKQRVCVINEAFAKRFFAGRSPLGMHVTQFYGSQRNTYEVIGVAANMRKRSLRGEIEHRYFVPASRPVDVPPGITFAIRTGADPGAVSTAVRSAILAEDANLPVGTARTLSSILEGATRRERLLARLSFAFGAVALLLAAIGSYAVLSYGVSRRTAEIGIRKALGAAESAVVAMVLRETSLLVAGGLAVGAMLAFGGLRWIESRLFGLKAADPATLLAAACVLAAVAMAAAWIPARRASRIDPLTAIRCD